MHACRAAFALTLTLLLAGAVAPTAQAQSSKEEKSKAKKMAAIDAEIEKRRQEAPIPDEGTVDMNGVDLHKKRQMEILQARLGNNALGAEKEKQYEDASARGFTVRKFKGSASQRERERRGYTPPTPGIDPPGKPLVHKERHGKHFLFF